MRTTTCDCGAELGAENLDALVPVALAHFTEEHPELGLVATNVRDYLEAEDRLRDAATERLDHLGEVRVVPATAHRLDDLLEFFDHIAFAGNPAWAGCYCLCHHVARDADPPWPRRGAAQNRAELIERIESGATTGMLAYVDGRPAAWVNASPRTEFPEHRAQTPHADDVVGSIVCFIVAPPYRRHGLAEQLLTGACEHFREHGMQVAEAYPRKVMREDDAGAYHGPLNFYLGAGFTKVAETDRFLVVQRALN